MIDGDDRRLGVLLREIRRREHIRQEDLARLAAVPRRDVILVEGGQAGDVRLDRVRRMFAAVAGRARIVAYWRGAEADRIVDVRHAMLVERVVRVLLRRGWECRTEVSFSRFGERGSVDVVGARRDLSTAAIIEVKGSIGSLEDTNRRLDVKVRLAGQIVSSAFGWSPTFIGRILVVPDGMTERRIVERHAATMAATYPGRSREVRAWLRRPEGTFAGLWFLSDVRDRDGDSR